MNNSDLLVDYTDVPIHDEYISFLSQMDIKPVERSKWFNAVSANLSKKQYEKVKTLPFVKDCRPVAKFKRKGVSSDSEQVQLKKKSNNDWDYGFSLNQNNLHNVPEVHARGITGKGIIIALFDTGFRLNHRALKKLNVLSQYDFINDDSNVDYDPEQDVINQCDHGTKILSIIGGFESGELIGPAFDASYVLAKTEDITSETPIEEDHWIAAAEWADSLGVDIISSSVGYTDWYNYKDMDGDTPLISQAADMAVKKGIVIVTSAGNEGDTRWRYIVAPADGDSVIAVGAINRLNTVTSFSSRGPSFDGRIKPDVMALGENVYCVDAPRDTIEYAGFDYISGTSASCPLVSGICALLLSAHPQINPIQLRNALIATADRAEMPNNDYGYGKINAEKALMFLEKQYSGIKQPVSMENLDVFDISFYPNPYMKSSQIFTIELSSDQNIHVDIDIYNYVGQNVKGIWEGPLVGGKPYRYKWDGLDRSGRAISSGIYILRIKSGNNLKVFKITVLN